MAGVKPALAQPPRVVICGGGVIGSAIAYFLSLRGVAATIIERTEVACAASGDAVTACCASTSCYLVSTSLTEVS